MRVTAALLLRCSGRIQMVVYIIDMKTAISLCDESTRTSVVKGVLQT